MKTVRVLHVAGARPNFMKIAPVLAECSKRPMLESLLVHTGQHYDDKMSRLFFDELGIPRPDVNLGVGSGSHAFQTARILERIESVLLEWKPDLVLVVGDVNSTVACTLAAVKLGIPVGHVEAGLRSFDRSMPEEINRVLTDAIADLLFVSEPSGVENLRNEGIDEVKIHFVGNVMIDTLLQHRRRSRQSRILEELDLEEGRYGLLTLHRPANVDDPATLSGILEPILDLSRDLPVVFPAHPRTRKRLSEVAGLPRADSRLLVLDPLGYLDFVRLMANARIVLTDSGGVQEETTALAVPCVTIRENTERPVTLAHGTNRLGGTTSDRIRQAIADAMQATPEEVAGPPLWDGRAAQRIATIIEGWARGR